MATEIVNTGIHPAVGEIDILQLNQIIEDFNTLEIPSGPPRFIKKHLVVTYSRNALDSMLKSSNSSWVSIHFGITLPGQKDCSDNPQDISNRLTAVMCMSDFVDPDWVDHMDVGNQVLVEGFRMKMIGAAPQCCGGPRPGNGG